MDAEMVRDYALAASGLLVDQIGGPSVKPYQPPGVWEAVAMNGSNTRELPARHRRGPLPPQHVHVLEAVGPARLAGHLQRPVAGDLHGHAGSGPTRRCRRWSRSTIRSSSRRPATWPSRALAQPRRRFRRPARLQWLAALLARAARCRGARRLARAASLDTISRPTTRAIPTTRRQLVAVGESPTDTGLDPPANWPPGRCWPKLMNLDEVLNK